MPTGLTLSADTAPMIETVIPAKDGWTYWWTEEDGNWCWTPVIAWAVSGANLLPMYVPLNGPPELVDYDAESFLGVCAPGMDPNGPVEDDEDDEDDEDEDGSSLIGRVPPWASLPCECNFCRKRVSLN